MTVSKKFVTNSIPKLFTAIKYVYLVGFFVLLAGMFHPLISGVPGDYVAMGTMVLLLGFGGGILVYKSPTARRQTMYFGTGLGFMALSTFLILQLTGRI